MKTIGAAGFSLLAGSRLASGYSESDYQDEVKSIMDTYDIHGVSVGIIENGWYPDSYQKAFGYNRQDLYYELLSTDHRLRLASVSKLLTSTAIMQLIDDGDLDYDQQVFGSGGILSPYYYGDPQLCTRMKISDLLNHNYTIDGGGSRPVYDAPNDYDVRDTIEYIHDNHTVRRFHGPYDKCKSGYDYYNYGYGVLGAVVEEVTGGWFSQGDHFRSYVNDNVLDPVNADGMDTVENEHGAVEDEGYHYSDYGEPYSEDRVRHRSWGWSAWAARPMELVRFGRGVMRGTISPISDPDQLTDYGWGSYGSPSGDDYVGHSGAQVGVLAALRCRDDHTLCVLINTRNDWDDDADPRTDLVIETRNFAQANY